jgi:organic radical activating enzyme
MRIHDLDFILTNSCNLRCPYCDHTYIYGRKPISIKTYSKQDFQKFCKLISQSEIISLGGGEPGLNNRHSLENFLEVVDSCKNPRAKLYLYTNGLFIEKYRDLCTNFDLIVVHLAPEPSKKHLEFVFKYHQSNMIYHIVLHKHNVQNIKNFIDSWETSYPLLRIGIFTSDVQKLRDVFELSVDQIQEIIAYMNHKPNIKIIYEKSKLNQNKLIDFYARMYCFYYKSNMVVDLEECKIIRCCWMCPPKSIPLGRLELIDSDYFSSFDYDRCRFCNHVNINFKDPQFIRWVSKHVSRMGNNTRL